VLLLGLAVSAAAATLASAVVRTSLELRAQRDVFCARYGAHAGIEAGPLADGRPDLVSADLDSLRVEVRIAPDGSCLLWAEAGCGAARRVARRRREPALCGSGGLRFRTPP
jgi:hypothetical protein